MTLAPATRGRAATWIARALLAGFAVALALIVLLPSDGHRVLGLVHTIATVAAELGVPYRFAFTVIEFGANIALFVPLGVLLPLALGPGRTLTPMGAGLVGLAASLLIELAQLGIPGRVSSPFDVLANTLGAALGAVLLAAVRDAFAGGSRGARGG